MPQTGLSKLATLPHVFPINEIRQLKNPTPKNFFSKRLRQVSIIRMFSTHSYADGYNLLPSRKDGCMRRLTVQQLTLENTFGG
ncbi:hypothetical protein CEXT_651811 [Caerostris extrusa]|uniref:Uncharacterized protein n=1 Tax=Caerostris extrusa TaxID=172846 RepID=A0AAV4X6F8_CAEEX|nr:hypothetical protein CEXT_651811 [Caerostris extrusa]